MCADSSGIDEENILQPQSTNTILIADQSYRSPAPKKRRIDTQGKCIFTVNLNCTNEATLDLSLSRISGLETADEQSLRIQLLQNKIRQDEEFHNARMNLLALLTEKARSSSATPWLDFLNSTN